MYRNWENHFHRLETLFSFTGSWLSTRIWYISQESGKQFPKTRNRVLIYWIQVVLPRSSILYRIWEKHFLETGDKVTIYWIQVASPRSGILCRVWETISRDQENGSHLLDPGCLPGSSTLYRNWGTIHRDREHGSHLLDPGCLTQIWYIMQKLGGKFERPGTRFSFWTRAAYPDPAI